MNATGPGAAKRNKPKFSSVLFVRCPPMLSAAVAREADRAMESVSTYIRGALMARLERGGVDFNTMEAEQPERGASEVRA